MTAFDLPTTWAFILAFVIFAYVVLDGFDLGIGILFPTLQSGQDRDQAMNSVAPIWDGNETWLVLGGGGLLAAFPVAYAVVMPALYAPIIAMLLALVFRGVAFETRWRDPGHQRFWDVCFAGGSIVAAFAQGVALGAMLQGITVEARAYAGGWWDWLSPFSLLTGVSLVIGYALLGATWLIMKTEGVVQEHAYSRAFLAAIATLVCLGLVSAATPFLENAYYEHWFAWPRILYTSQVPLLIAILFAALFVSLRRRYEVLPFLLSLGVFAVSMIGLGISVFPDIVPGAFTIHEAAAPHSSLVFMLVGVVILVPIILAYTGYAYWIFRGKVGQEGYH
ncbi:cytochrome d ubiquinol oxidase subunit II [Pseudaminobacter sp. 19-2017]|uniref:Cytochrome d ubiquinol oxidase subunit II n=1 Tax=Pseudaminobacter soli (ex Zhang et al. 2022) TaxID=2831468 RepID=A0A942E215_9HYPH|nr:cytochrome d ubiquinol oxidase subunit II [Pseudaminobacter soli]MBS3649733.1 cytochrome d ubiquinol oxidase subunit II [Pseudaminobacter soli]